MRRGARSPKSGSWKRILTYSQNGGWILYPSLSFPGSIDFVSHSYYIEGGDIRQSRFWEVMTQSEWKSCCVLGGWGRRNWAMERSIFHLWVVSRDRKNTGGGKKVTLPFPKKSLLPSLGHNRSNKTGFIGETICGGMEGTRIERLGELIYYIS